MLELRRVCVLALFVLVGFDGRPGAQSASPPTLTPGPPPPASMSVGAFTVDRDRNVYYVGVTTNPDFPTTPGAYSRKCGVDGACGRQFFGRPFSDVVLTKVGSDGVIKLSTFAGGDGQLSPRQIAQGPDGSIYIAGEFLLNPFIGPQRMPFANPSVPGCGQFDIFVARLDPAQLGLMYWTCIQGPYQQAPMVLGGLAVDRAGSAIIAGYVNNPEFPLVGAIPPFNAGRPGVHGYVKKLLPSGDIAFSIRLGGSGIDAIWGVAADREGAIYVGGNTSSPDFPVSRALQSVRKGTGDAFIARIDRDGRLLLFSTYLGGSADDVLWGLAVDRNDEVWVVGDTHSIDFPTTPDASRPVSLCAGNPDCANRNPSAFAARFDGAGALKYSTLIGPDTFDPTGPGGARLVDVLIGPANELELLGDFSDGMRLVRPLTTMPCGGACGMVMTIGPRGDVRFASRVPERNSLMSFSTGAKGRWALGPDGELYLLRSTAAFTTELIIIGVNQPDVRQPLP